MGKHRKFTPEFKSEVVLSVISGEHTAAELCHEHPPVLIWDGTTLPDN